MVLVGDFNESRAVPRSRSCRRRGCAARQAVGTGCAATFPGPRRRGRRLQIDHVFARGASFSAAKTVHAGGSDHYRERDVRPHAAHAPAEVTPAATPRGPRAMSHDLASS